MGPGRKQQNTEMTARTEGEDAISGLNRVFYLALLNKAPVRCCRPVPSRRRNDDDDDDATCLMGPSGGQQQQYIGT